MKRHSFLLAMVVLFALFAANMIMTARLGSQSASLFNPFLTKREPTQDRLARMLTSARRHILITDLSPFLGEVKNVRYLRSQYSFYDRAEEGDVLIMTEDRAILYRPSLDVLVDAISRSEAYGSRIPPGVDRLSTTSASSSATTRSARSQSSEWVLEPIGGATSSKASSQRSSATSSRRSSAQSSAKSGSSARAWNLVP